MKKNGLTEEETKAYAFGATIILFLLLFGIGYFWNKSGNLQTEKNQLKIKQDSLMVVKNRLDKDLTELASQLESSIAQKNLLASNNDQLSQTLAQKDKIIFKYKKDAQNVVSLKKQISELISLKNQLQSQLDKINDINQKLLSENNSLKEQNARLAEENETLKGQVPGPESATIKPLLSAGSFRVEVLRKNNKLTVKSRRSRQIEISFDVPEDIDINGTQTVFVSIKNQNSNPIKDADNIDIEVKLKSGKVVKTTAQMTQKVDFSSLPKRVTIKYDVEDKLKAGYYFIDIYTEDTYVGTVQFRLI
ncbi:hypothetical protein [Emticicia sp. SJ17W-69]|uniref:hypothetical protein n=1 Tax=Emticicia sp. SJ17W-69 TaxID=3421657 RepID=UPI003EBE7ECD